MFERIKAFFQRGEDHTTQQLADAQERIRVLEGRLEFAQGENNSLGQRNQLLHYALGSSHTALETYANRNLWHVQPGMEYAGIQRIKWSLAQQALQTHRDLLGLEPPEPTATQEESVEWQAPSTQTNESIEKPHDGLWTI